MNIQDQQIQLRQQLVLLTDAYITLSDNPAWLAMLQQYPELESLRLAAVQASDNIWFSYRARLVTRDSDD